LLVAKMAGGDDTLVGSVILEQIAADDSCSHTFAINPRKVYAAHAACDGDCSDIDLLGEEYVPILVVMPDASGDSLTVIST
jgi:hypothetical protein